MSRQGKNCKREVVSWCILLGEFAHAMAMTVLNESNIKRPSSILISFACASAPAECVSISSDGEHIYMAKQYFILTESNKRQQQGERAVRICQCIVIPILLCTQRLSKFCQKRPPLDRRKRR